jgi:hypothetical protein
LLDLCRHLIRLLSEALYLGRAVGMGGRWTQRPNKHQSQKACKKKLGWGSFVVLQGSSPLFDNYLYRL